MTVTEAAVEIAVVAGVVPAEIVAVAGVAPVGVDVAVVADAVEIAAATAK